MVNNLSILNAIVVLTKVKLTFKDTIIRLEHLPKESKTGAAMEIRVDRYGKTFFGRNVWDCHRLIVNQITGQITNVF